MGVLIIFFIVVCIGFYVIIRISTARCNPCHELFHVRGNSKKRQNKTEKIPLGTGTGKNFLPYNFDVLNVTTVVNTQIEISRCLEECDKTTVKRRNRECRDMCNKGNK